MIISKDELLRRIEEASQNGKSLSLGTNKDGRIGIIAGEDIFILDIVGADVPERQAPEEKYITFRVPRFRVAFTVPGKPVGQGRPRTTVRNDRAIIYKPENSKRYEAEIAKEAANAMRGMKPFAHPVSLGVFVYKAPPSGATKKQREAMLKGELCPTTKPDLDNVIKAVADALTGVVWEDDRQVVMIDAAQYFAEEPLVKVEVADIVEKLN